MNKNKIKKIIGKNGLLIVSLFLALFVFSAKPAAAAGLAEAVGSLLAWILSYVNYALGYILTFLLNILVAVAQYNRFIVDAPVEAGWTIVRDLCNMFFILILLVIAFATILRAESYQWKKMLPKLLIMAVLINFSKTIAGLIIDFAQVIMLTFVSAFSQNGANNFVQMFGIDKYLTKANCGDGTNLGYAIILGSVSGTIALIVTLVVTVVLLAVLVMRIVMLWIYVILSPLAYLLAAFPQGQRYAGQWWSEFSKNVITGPILAFFIWLALTTGANTQMYDTTASNAGKFGGEATSEVCAGTNLFTRGPFQKYIVVIGLLIGGLMVTQQMGGAAAGVAGRGMGWIRKGGAAMTGAAAGAALLSLHGGKKLASFVVDKTSEKVGVDLNVTRGYARLKKQMEENKRSREARIYGRAVETAEKGGFLRSKAALFSTGDVAWQGITSFKGSQYKRFLRGGKWANKFGQQMAVDQDERKKIWSKKQQDDAYSKLSSLHVHDAEIAQKVSEQKMAVATAPKDQLEEEKNKLTKLELERKQTQDQIKALDHDTRTMPVNDERAAELDKSITKNKALDQKYRLQGADVASAAVSAELERQEAPKISHIENADQLGKILKEAIEEGNAGLIAATSKKMTKMGDYNEMMNQLDLGTGRDGMHGLAKMFEARGRMTRQGSLGLIAEIGGIAKNVNHFGAFGAAIMDNGRWRESTQDEMDSAQLAEMLKKQPQAYARDVNRLGLGYYTSKEQTTDNWRPSRAALAYLKLNAGPMGKQYEDTGQQNAIEHLAKNLGILEKNGIYLKTKGGEDVLKQRTQDSKGRGVDVGMQVRSIQT